MVILPPSVKMVTASLHPAYGLRGFPQMLPLIRDVMQRPLRESVRPPLDVRVGSTARVIEEFVLNKTNIINADIETDRDDQPDIIGMSDARRPERVFVAAWSDAVAGVLRPWLGRQENVVVGHNFPFDFERIEETGLPIEAGIADTMNACAMLLPAIGRAKKQKWFALETCTLRHVAGWPAWKPTRHKDGTVDWTYAHKLFKAWFPQVPSWMYEQLYCGIDVGATGYLWQAVVPLLQENGMWELFKDVVCPCIPVLTRMTARGIGASEPMRAALKEQVEKRYEIAAARVVVQTQERHDIRLRGLEGAVYDLQQRAIEIENKLPLLCPVHRRYRGKAKPRSTKEGCLCRDIFDGTRNEWELIRSFRKEANEKKATLKRLGPTFQVGNPNAWRWLLYEELQLVPPPSARTDAGTPKVDMRSLEALARKYEGREDLSILKERMAVAHALHRWDPRKKSGTLAAEVGRDGRLHYPLNMHRSNGRIASGKDDDVEGKFRPAPGNGLNIMKPDRMMFVPTLGWFLSLDFSQIEARLVAWEARDIQMLQALREGKDIHCLTAAAMYGLPDERAEETRTNKVEIQGRWYTQRFIMKKVRHGKNYGMGIQRAADETGLPLDMVARAYAADNRRWPMTARWQETIKRKVTFDRQLRNAWGRLHRVYDFKFDKKMKAWVPTADALKTGLSNNPQTNASEILKSVLPGVWWACRQEEAWLVLPPHDQVLVDTTEEAIPRLVAAIKPIMEQEWPQMGAIPGFGWFKCPVDVEVGRNWGEMHVEHTEECEVGCLVNAEGMRKREAV